MLRFLFSLFYFIVVFSSFSQTQVVAYQPGNTAEGITYFLPTTRLRWVITATKVRHIPGEYAAYAERYLRLKNVPQEVTDTWELISIEGIPYGEANKAQAYSIALKPKTAAPLVGLAPDGRLLSVNGNAPSLPTLPQPSVSEQRVEAAIVKDYRSQDILLATSPYKMAELIAHEIYDIRENRSLLAKGQADFMPKDGEQLRLMLANLDKQEEMLLRQFVGTRTEETHTFVLDFTPERDVEQQVLFRFSRHLGLVDSDDLAGAPYYISVKDLQTLPPVASNVSEKNKKTEEPNLRYIVPSNAQIRVFSSSREWVLLTLPLAQFGRVELLGSELFNKKFTSHLQLSPIFGGIVSLTQSP